MTDDTTPQPGFKIVDASDGGRAVVRDGGKSPAHPAVSVEQCDRDAAALIMISREAEQSVRDGKSDSNPVVQAFARHRLSAAPPADGVPAGFCLVPAEPTETMCSAAAHGLRNLINSVPFEERELRWGKPRKKLGYCIPHNEKHRARYKAMLSAAPKAPTAPPADGVLREALIYCRQSLGDPLPIGRRHVARKIDEALAYDAEKAGA